MAYNIYSKETRMDALKTIEHINIEALSKDPSTPLCKVVCYPKHSIDCCRERLSTLRKMGAIGIVNYGFKNISGLNVLDVGYSSVIVLVVLSNNSLAVAKILRMDSRRRSLREECSILEITSSNGISPRLIDCSNDIIMLEYVDGIVLGRLLGEYTHLYRVKDILRAAIYKAFLLDSLGIDHGELSRPYKHVLVSPRGVFIIDYESASTRRKPSNVTSIVSGLVLRKNKLTLSLRSMLGLSDKEEYELKGLLREYKKKPNYNILVKILSCIKLL